MQASHDILYLGTEIAKYDHLEFPGVVPRTFIGSLITSYNLNPEVKLRALSFPFVKIWQMFQQPRFVSLVSMGN